MRRRRIGRSFLSSPPSLPSPSLSFLFATVVAAVVFALERYEKRTHLYSMDILDVVSKPRGVVDLALEENSGNLGK